MNEYTLNIPLQHRSHDYNSQQLDHIFQTVYEQSPSVDYRIAFAGTQKTWVVSLAADHATITDMVQKLETITGQEVPTLNNDTYQFLQPQHTHDQFLHKEPIERGYRTHEPLQQLADAYRSYMGIEPHTVVHKEISDTRQQAFFQERFDSQVSDIGNPQVQAGYDALIRETRMQVQFLDSAGYHLHHTHEKAHQADGGDIVVNAQCLRTLNVYDALPVMTDLHPMDTVIPQAMNHQPLRLVQQFDIAHQAFGHAIQGYSRDNLGLENALHAHASLYSAAALPAYLNEVVGHDRGVHTANILPVPEAMTHTVQPETRLESYRLQHSHDIDALILQMVAGEGPSEQLDALKVQLLPDDYTRVETMVHNGETFRAYQTMSQFNFRSRDDIERPVGDHDFWVESLCDTDVLISLAHDDSTAHYQFEYALKNGLDTPEFWDKVQEAHQERGTWTDCQSLVLDIRPSVPEPQYDHELERTR